MNTESFRALRRANPRTRVGFAESLAAASRAVRVRIEAEGVPLPSIRSRRRFVHVSAAGASLAVAAFVAAVLTVGLPGGGSGIDSATASVERAVTVTADSAESSGTAVIRMTHDGQLWAGKTIRWNGDDVAISGEKAGGGRKAGELLVVDGVLYGIEPEGGWIAFGDPRSIDPDSGTTPAEYLAAVREDVGGTTLRRITRGMSGLTTGALADGSTVYSGTVAAGLVARESGVKDGQTLRVLPFGYVANDQAADPAAPLKASVTVGADGVVREIAVTWGTWTYTVAYRGLGATAAPTAPENATPLKRWRAIP